MVLAAGCWSGGLGGVAAEALPPVRPVKGQLLYLRGRPTEPLCQRNVRGLEVYVVPRGDGRVVVGATVEEQGFDTRVTAGAVHDLLRAALELLPDVAELELAETVWPAAGVARQRPMLGPAGPEGLVVATGHYRNGILLAPVTADAVAELLATGRVPDLIARSRRGGSRRGACRVGREAVVTVIVNGQPAEVDPGQTVAGLLARLGHPPGGPGIAVALNGEVVPRSAWPTTPRRQRPPRGARRLQGG